MCAERHLATTGMFIMTRCLSVSTLQILSMFLCAYEWYSAYILEPEQNQCCFAWCNMAPGWPCKRESSLAK